MASPEVDHRRLAAALFNETWTLMEQPARTPEENDAMIAKAQASRYHWSLAGGVREAAIGHWQCSRVLALVGLADAAAYHAERSLALAASLGPFLLGAAHEACARAAAARGDTEARRRHLDDARTQLALVTDPEEHSVLEGDIASVPGA